MLPRTLCITSSREVMSLRSVALDFVDLSEPLATETSLQMKQGWGYVFINFDGRIENEESRTSHGPVFRTVGTMTSLRLCGESALLNGQIETGFDQDKD